MIKRSTDIIVQDDQLSLPVAIAQSNTEGVRIDFGLQFGGKVSRMRPERDTSTSSDGRFLVSGTSFTQTLLRLDLAVATVDIAPPLCTGSTLA